MFGFKKKSYEDLKAEEKEYKSKLRSKAKKDFEKAKYAKTKKRVKDLRKKARGDSFLDKSLTTVSKGRKTVAKVAKDNNISFGKNFFDESNSNSDKKSKSKVRSPQEIVFGK